MPNEVEKTTDVVAPEKSEAKAEKPAEAKKPAARKPRRTTKKASAKKPLVKEGASAKETIEAKVNLFFESNKTNKELKKIISVSKLMEAGAHVGLASNLWNPKMAPFIYRSKNSRNLIIDMLKIIVFANRAYNFLYDIAKEDGKILFVGTHNDSVKKYVQEEATRCGAFYINQRWLGGTLTNFRTVNNSINKLHRLTTLLESENIGRYTKKQQLDMQRQAAKLEKFIGGIKNMKGLPQVVVVTDPIAEHNAVKEARDLHIPVVAIANTNANPDLIDFIIPANTHSIKTQWLLVSILADAIASAKGQPTKIVGKADGEIVLPETIKVQRKIVFSRGRQADTFVKSEPKK
ncbi:MAG: 30S ribosomal protein S2 [Mycoplasmoidaceae bacterium]